MRFHPTLVLAQLKILLDISNIYGLFPSHIGSRSTRTVRTELLKINDVSIPHWFSLNKAPAKKDLNAEASFHPTLVLAQRMLCICCCALHMLVSIPHWFSLNVLQGSKRKVLLRVSIPHWFSLNVTTKHSGFAAKMGFHPTLVLAQRKVGIRRAH